jgi:sterol desaturase/sphingolipid hydroxylase (fatty acid hydroxylase superfamily)
MKDFRIDNRGSGQLFQNKFLERLTRTPFIVPVAFYYILSVSCLWVAYKDPDIPLLAKLWLVPAGMIVFSFVEYLIHRYIFHFKATSQQQERLQYSIHGVHHEYPRDKERLVMPLVLSVILAGLFFLLFSFLMGTDGLIFYAGFIAGYSSYLVIHYAVHAIKPPQNFLKYWWKHHSLHHYASVHSAFSVSFPLWDILFGTMPSQQERKRVAERMAETP